MISLFSQHGQSRKYFEPANGKYVNNLSVVMVVFDCVFYGCFPPVCLVSDVTASFVCLSQEGVPRVRIIFGAFPVGLDIYFFHFSLP